MGNQLSHNPYFNRWFSAINCYAVNNEVVYGVTILILIDGFLQCICECNNNTIKNRHNPYFNRWFSAIKEYVSLDQPLFMSQSLF